MKPPMILVIDDNPITRKIVRVALQSASYDCCEAEDGRSALALVRQSLPDLVLQDLLLPDMDSFALVKELRAIARDLPIPILACSGSLSRLEQARNIVMGFTDFLPKPIEPSRLLRTIDAYLAAKRDMVGKSGKNRRVLIADDDPVQRKLLKIHLTQLGYQVATAANGRDALAQARATPPDAIVSDILMPELDGFKLCMEIRRDPRLAALPVILTSVAFIEEADQRLAHNAGANALILRTADFREIITALQQLLNESAPAPQRSNVTATAEELYVHRITRQLERQASHNEALTRRMKWIEAELGILAGFAETLRNTSAIETILDEQLHHCLNALGISKGAIYLLDENQAFCLRAQLGYEAGGDDLQHFFGHGDTLRLALDHRLLLDIPSDEVATEIADHLLQQARAKALLIMPLLLGDEQLGALVIASARKETNGDWYTLIRAVGSQISQAIGLARAISQLREKEERLARIVETVPDGIILLDLKGQVTSANTSAERILGIETAAMTATRLPFLDQIWPGATLHGMEHRFLLAGGGDIFLSINAAPLRDGEGQIMGTVVTISDITAHKRAEQESQRLDQMKDDFMNVASHEMRTPLTSLLLASRLIQRRVERGESAVALSQLAEDIITHAKRMNRVIEDMLDMTHITSGQLYIRKERCDICALLRQSIVEQQFASKREIVLSGADAPIVGEIDRDRVWQVIANLISNAIKYSPPVLPIEVAVGDGQDDDARRWLTITVRDRGRGIAPEYLPHVFERFYRIANSDPTIAAQQTDGLGLGLFIADAVVKAHGGTITARSAIGQGSTFTVKLPLDPA